MMAQRIVRLAIVTLTVMAASCAAPVREGTGTSFLMISNLEGASGAEPDDFGSVVHSDVAIGPPENHSVFNDLGRVTFQLGLKDPGTPTSPSQPTQNQFITLDSYRVRYVRADGRNTPGVDVPYGFDGALTVTVSGSVTTSFELVRHVAKLEAPLGALAFTRVIISTIAEVTFFGRDQTGHEVSVTGRMSVDFGNFGDPE
jgi:hypothetical protein